MKIPEPQVVFDRLTLIMPHIYSALQHGTFKTKEFFEQQVEKADKKVCPYLAPNLVRFYAKRVLEGMGQPWTQRTWTFLLTAMPIQARRT